MFQNSKSKIKFQFKKLHQLQLTYSSYLNRTYLFYTEVMHFPRTWMLRVNREKILAHQFDFFTFEDGIYYYFVWTRCCMLCVCHTTTTHKLFCLNFSSGWATTMGRLLGLKVGNSIKCLSQGQSDALLHQESNQGFKTFWLLAWCLTNWATLPPTCYNVIRDRLISFFLTDTDIWSQISANNIAADIIGHLLSLESSNIAYRPIFKNSNIGR